MKILNLSFAIEPPSATASATAGREGTAVNVGRRVEVGGRGIDRCEPQALGLLVLSPPASAIALLVVGVVGVERI